MLALDPLVGGRTSPVRSKDSLNAMHRMQVLGEWLMLLSMGYVCTDCFGTTWHWRTNMVTVRTCEVRTTLAPLRVVPVLIKYCSKNTYGRVNL
jgi:hypothetical protein